MRAVNDDHKFDVVGLGFASEVGFDALRERTRVRPGVRSKSRVVFSS